MTDRIEKRILRSKSDIKETFLRLLSQKPFQQIKNPYRYITKVNLKEMHAEDFTLFTYLKEQAALYKLLLSDHIQVDFRYQMARVIEDLL